MEARRNLLQPSSYSTIGCRSRAAAITGAHSCYRIRMPEIRLVRALSPQCGQCVRPYVVEESRPGDSSGHFLSFFGRTAGSVSTVVHQSPLNQR